MLGFPFSLSGFMFVLTFLSFSASIHFFQWSGILFMPFGSKVHRTWQRMLAKKWSELNTFLTQSFLPSEFILTGDTLDADETNFYLISNHQIYADWWYLWILCWFRKRGSDVKILLKSTLKWVPIFGPGMYFFMDFIFLERKWAKDAIVLKSKLRSLAEDQVPIALLLFPEGTTNCREEIEKTARFAKKNGLVPLRHMLLPRVTGIYHTIKETRHYIPYLYDVTIGYKPLIPGQIPEETYTLSKVFCRGQAPDVHMHVRRYDVKDIPEDEAEFSAWLHQVYREKDEYLAHFFKHGYFTKDGVVNLNARRAVFYPYLPFLIPLMCFMTYCAYSSGYI